MNTRAKFGWRRYICVRRPTIARGSLSTAAELGGASNHVPRRTTTRPQTPSRLTSWRYAGEPKLASRACSNLASRVLNYALILATLTPLSSWLTVASSVLSAANCDDLSYGLFGGGGTGRQLKCWDCFKSIIFRVLRVAAKIAFVRPDRLTAPLRPSQPTPSARLVGFPKVPATPTPITGESEILGPFAPDAFCYLSLIANTCSGWISNA